MISTPGLVEDYESCSSDNGIDKKSIYQKDDDDMSTTEITDHQGCNISRDLHDVKDDCKINSSSEVNEADTFGGFVRYVDPEVDIYDFALPNEVCCSDSECDCIDSVIEKVEVASIHDGKSGPVTCNANEGKAEMSNLHQSIAILSCSSTEESSEDDSDVELEPTEANPIVVFATTVKNEEVSAQKIQESFKCHRSTYNDKMNVNTSDEEDSDLLSSASDGDENPTHQSDSLSSDSEEGEKGELVLEDISPQTVENRKSAKSEAILTRSKIMRDPASIHDHLKFVMPQIEDLFISLPSTECRWIGKISSVIHDLVVVQSSSDSNRTTEHRKDASEPPHLIDNSFVALNEDTILFTEEGRNVLGPIFEIFGPVVEPCYSVRFNSPSDIEVKGLAVGQDVYFGPRTKFTNFVFNGQLQKLNEGCVDSVCENGDSQDDGDGDQIFFSDDEQERLYMMEKKQKKDLKNNPFYRKSQKQESQTQQFTASYNQRQRGRKGRGRVARRQKLPINTNVIDSKTVTNLSATSSYPFFDDSAPPGTENELPHSSTTLHSLSCCGSPRNSRQRQPQFANLYHHHICSHLSNGPPTNPCVMVSGSSRPPPPPPPPFPPSDASARLMAQNNDYVIVPPLVQPSSPPTVASPYLVRPPPYFGGYYISRDYNR